MKETERQILDLILSKHPRNGSELITILQETQEKFGYLPADVMKSIAKYLCISPSVLYGAATFYTQFKFTPTGRRVIKVCRGTACHVRGSAVILNKVEEQLNIKVGETSVDGANSLETTACFGSCALAPVIVVNKDVYGRMNANKVRQVLKETQE
jgi:NADH-quinone oxidoreductase subunit E